MLNIYFRDEDDGNVYTDVESEFKAIELIDTPVIRKIIKDTEGGEYRTPKIFTDKFGGGLYTSFLSTGCKTALLIEIRAMKNNNSIIDTAECGYNALDTIIMNCRNGSILMQRPLTPISHRHKESTSIDVCYNGFRFTDITRLNFYLFNESESNDPDMLRQGIEKLDDSKVFRGDYRELFKHNKFKED